MYKVLLILKYLGKRRIAWVSLIAVMLCTTMVLVVSSVMGGWLATFRESFKGLSGDVIVDGKTLSGFSNYGEIAAEIEKEPGVVAAVPVVQTLALINIDNRKIDGVIAVGYPIERIGAVNRFTSSLHYQKDGNPTFGLPLPAGEYERIRRGSSRWPGMIAGVGVVGIRRNEKGEWVGRDEKFLRRLPIKLSVIPIQPGMSTIDLSNKAERSYWLVDDSRTGVFESDTRSVYVPFGVLQQDVGMAPAQFRAASSEPETGFDAVWILPARTTHIQVKLAAGVKNLEAAERITAAVDRVRARVRERERASAEVTARVRAEYANDWYLPRVATVVNLHTPDAMPPSVATWEQTQSQFLSAVENEKSLVTFLFSIISVVAIFLVFVIFYMIVVEKTKDIGIIKSVGATNRGVAGIFLGYGLTIGLIGAAAGLGLALLIVHNINEIHTAFGQITGRQIWNPATYRFDTIPNKMLWNEAWVILGIAVMSAVLGALVPAVRAARLNPVESLRWE